MIEKLLKNCGKPQGIGGKLILNAMNRGHAPLCVIGYYIPFYGQMEQTY